MKIGFVIPARLKSTRLPKKILLKFNGKSALEWAILRAKSSKYIDEVVVATTALPIDSEITKVCIDQKIRYFQGDPEDVLKRFLDTAKYFEFDYIVNITPDNTLFSPYLIDLMVSSIKDNPEVDYFNFKKSMLGTGIYAIKREALEIICEFKDMSDTEIWGPLFKNEYFNVKSIPMPDFLDAEYRLTLDTSEDYRFLKKLYSKMNINENNLVELVEIIDFLDNNSEIAAINSKVKQTALDQKILAEIDDKFRNNKEIFYELRSKIVTNRRY